MKIIVLSRRNASSNHIHLFPHFSSLGFINSGPCRYNFRAPETRLKIFAHINLLLNYFFCYRIILIFLKMLYGVLVNHSDEFFNTLLKFAQVPLTLPLLSLVPSFCTPNFRLLPRTSVDGAVSCVPTHQHETIILFKIFYLQFPSAGR